MMHRNGGTGRSTWITMAVATAVLSIAVVGPVAASGATTPRSGAQSTAHKGTGSVTTSTTTATSGKRSWLFSQTAGGGTLTPNSDGTYQLTLTDIDPHAVAFTDRPYRNSVIIKSAKLPKAWPKLFASAPPNAVVVARTAGGGTDSLVVELTDPSVSGTTERFTAKIINDEGHPSGLSQITGTSAAAPPPDLGQVSLFIDNVQPQGVACFNVDFRVINPPGTLTPAQVNQPGTMHTFEQECDAAHGYVTLV